LHLINSSLVIWKWQNKTENRINKPAEQPSHRKTNKQNKETNEHRNNNPIVKTNFNLKTFQDRFKNSTELRIIHQHTYPNKENRREIEIDNQQPLNLTREWKIFKIGRSFIRMKISHMKKLTFWMVQE